MATNFIFQGRSDLVLIERANNKYDSNMKKGKFEDKSIYIVDDDLMLPVLMHLNPDKDLFAKIDGFNVLAPGWVNCETCPKVDPAHLLQKTIPKVHINIPIQFSKNGIGPEFLIGVDAVKNVGYGWAYPEAWGVWSEGRKAKLIIPLPNGEESKQLVLTVRAFTSDQFPNQRVDVWINGSLQQKVILNKDTSKEIIIPIAQSKDKDYIVVELRTPDAMSPKELGIGDDIRKLAVGLEAAVFR